MQNKKHLFTSKLFQEDKDIQFQETESLLYQL